MKCEKKKEKEELATYGVRTKACGMRDTLRRLSEGFRDRLKRFDSTHNTGKYVRVSMCYLFVLTLFFSLRFFSPALPLSSHTQTKTKETSCLRFENNHFLSLPFVCFFSFTFFFSRLAENEINSHWSIAADKRESEEKISRMLIKDCKSTVTAIFYTLVTISLLSN